MVKKKIKGKDMVKKRKKVKDEKRLKNKKIPLHQNALFISFSFIYFFQIDKRSQLGSTNRIIVILHLLIIHPSIHQSSDHYYISYIHVFLIMYYIINSR